MFIEKMETFRRLSDIGICFYYSSLFVETGPVGGSLLDDNLIGGGP